MSSNDPLLCAFEALRDAHDGKPEGSRTRQRLLAEARRRRDSRYRVLHVLIPAAATLLVSAAWADSTGRLAPWRAAVRKVLEPSASEPDLVLPPRVGASRPPPPTVVPLDPPPIQSELHTAVPDERATAAEGAELRAPVVRAPEELPPPSRPPLPHAPVRMSVQSEQSQRPTGDSEDALFAAAQAAHFAVHDASSALQAWDAYLAAFPHGRFELEARYNRAATLLRLGRDDEARTALIPFAKGRYRAREARLLLQALGDDH
jgi:hypothetical protein